MKQETPMQELINWINSYCTPMDCVLKAKELLEKEKQAIIDAYKKGFTDNNFFYEDESEDYFNNKYNTK